jgi:hypothetical protein
MGKLSILHTYMVVMEDLTSSLWFDSRLRPFSGDAM